MTKTIKSEMAIRNAMSDVEYSLNTLKLEKLLSLLDLTTLELEVIASGRSFSRGAIKKRASENRLPRDNN